MSIKKPTIRSKSSPSNKHKTAIKQHESLIKLRTLVSVAYLKIGKILKKIRDDKLYNYIYGEGIDSFSDYIKTPEIQFSKRKAYYLIEIYEKFCEDLEYKVEELKGLNWTSLRAITPLVNKDNASRWIESAKNLTVRDLEIAVKQEEGKLEDPMICNHELKNNETAWEHIEYWRCKKCLSTSRILPKNWKPNKNDD